MVFSRSFTSPVFLAVWTSSPQGPSGCLRFSAEEDSFAGACLCTRCRATGSPRRPPFGRVQASMEAGRLYWRRWGLEGGFPIKPDRLPFGHRCVSFCWICFGIGCCILHGFYLHPGLEPGFHQPHLNHGTGTEGHPPQRGDSYYNSIILRKCQHWRIKTQNNFI